MTAGYLLKLGLAGAVGGAAFVTLVLFVGFKFNYKGIRSAYARIAGRTVL